MNPDDLRLTNNNNNDDDEYLNNQETNDTTEAAVVVAAAAAQDNRSLYSQAQSASAARFAYNAYPSLKPTNPIYNSTTTDIKPIKKRKMIAKPQKYSQLAPEPIADLRWWAILSALFFFPTGLVAVGLAVKAQRKFHDGFIKESKKMNTRAIIFTILSIVFGLTWILGMFFAVDKWPRTNG